MGSLNACVGVQLGAARGCAQALGARGCCTPRPRPPPPPPPPPAQLFPYHLAEYVCRVLRVTPYRFYTNVLVDVMREDQPYDAIPNFTVGALVGGWVEWEGGVDGWAGVLVEGRGPDWSLACWGAPPPQPACTPACTHARA